MANKNITLNSTSGVVLNTNSKYCDGDIVVTPRLQEKTVSDTAVSAVLPDSGYAGLGRVNIDITNAVKDIATVAEMESLLTENNVGKYFRYVGETSGKYTYGDIYYVDVLN